MELPRVSSSSLLACMRKKFQDRLQVLFSSFGGAGKSDDDGVLADSSYGSGHKSNYGNQLMQGRIYVEDLHGVIASDEASMPCTRPGACLWRRGVTAYSKLVHILQTIQASHTSGVLSWIANPVPPVVMMRFTGFSPSVQVVILRWISKTSSLTILVSDTSHLPPPSWAKTSFRIPADRSADGSLEAVVDTTRIAARKSGLDMLFTWGCFLEGRDI